MDDLLKLALLGTSNARGGPGMAFELFPDWSAPDLERTVLLRAGAQTLYESAGRQPAAPSAPPDPAALESRRVCSPGMTALLAELFIRLSRDITTEALLVEALQLLGAADLLLHPALLPAALNLSSPALREPLRSVVGERGVWLSQFRPEWNWVRALDTSTAAGTSLPPNADQRWEEGERSLRIALLQHARLVDSDRSRKWIAAVWSSEKADRRLEFLKLFEQGLSPDDQDFLEEVLKDRSANVRAVAAELLTQLPDSPTAIRLRQRADGLLESQAPSILERLSGGRRMQVHPPAEFNKEWAREGLEAKPPQGVGERAFWLSQILALVPPSHWQAKFQAEPAELISAVARHDFAQAVLVAWSVAAVRAKETAWIAALWDYWFALTPQNERDRSAIERSEQLRVLLNHLPATAAEERLLRLLDIKKGFGDFRIDDLLLQLPRPWSATFGQHYLTCLAQTLPSVDRIHSSQRGNYVESFPVAAIALPTACLTQALGPWTLPESDQYHVSYVRQQLDEFTATIRLRQRLREELSPPR